jgi:predicted small lipoprotein YifL
MLLLVAATLAGCGQTGGLYLPSDEAPVEVSEPADPATGESESTTEPSPETAP